MQKGKFWIRSVLIVFITILVAGTVIAQYNGKMTDKEVEEIAKEAYIYGYPLVTMDKTRQVMTNTVKANGSKAPMGQFVHLRNYPTSQFKVVTAPNADTLYSTAWLDLSKEPYILHVPDVKDRYYLMPLLSAWTDVFASIGTRTTGDSAASFVITGPLWTGKLPEGAREIKSPTNLVWILGRTYCTGTPEDYEEVHAIQDKYTLMPLSALKTHKPFPEGKFDPNIDMKTPVRDQVNKMEIQAYFNQLAKLMKDNPPSENDAPMIAKMKKIGVIPGKPFELPKNPSLAATLQSVPKSAFQMIMAHEKNSGTEVNGWTFSTKTGVYGTDYLQRAFITAVGLGANVPQDAIYPLTRHDKTGNPLTGENRYVIHFPKGQTPPVKGFWSLTMYNDQLFFVDNPLNRYTLSPRNALKYNKDGSLDLFIQNQSPGQDKESNWLPAPRDKFLLMLRLYWPKEGVINGEWKPPPVEPIVVPVK